MKICVMVILVLVAYVSADCGCLKCSRHLQGVDVPGPAGFPVKVIFRRPKPKNGCGCCCGCRKPSELPPNKAPEFCNVATPGGQYSATVQLPLPKLSKPRLPLKNLRYRTDTILVPPPTPTIVSSATPAVVNPSSLTTTDILNWLRNLQLAHQLAAQQQLSQQQPEVLPEQQVTSAQQVQTLEEQFPTVVPQLTVETVPCDCQRCQGNLSLKNHNFNIENESTQCSFCQKSKRSVPAQETSPSPNCQISKRSASLPDCQMSNRSIPLQDISSCPQGQRSKISIVTSQQRNFNDQNGNKVSSSKNFLRPKRDVTKRSYDFFMKMLPQSVREPLRHSVQGTQYLQQFQPKLTFKQKLDELIAKKSAGLKENTFNDHKPHAQYPLHQLNNVFHQPSKGALGPKSLNYVQKSKPFKTSFLDQRLDYVRPSSLFSQRGQSIDSLLEPTHSLSAKKNPKLSLVNREDPLEHLKSYTFENRPSKNLVFGKTKTSTSSISSSAVDPLLKNAYKTFLHKYGYPLSQEHTPKLSQRFEEEGAEEKTLLKKLKKLNNNPYTSNLEDQATAFMQKLLKPEESKTRHRRYIDDHPEQELLRKKRTIILGSDEIDLPAHYEVEMVSVEDDSEETQHEQIYSFEEFADEDPVVGASPFMRKMAPPRRYYPSLPMFQPKPEIVLGKKVIQKAVREELEEHHRKLEHEQKLKEMRENLKRKKQQSFHVPQNPIFALLTAPMKFLKHFHDLNRGATPVIATIPKLVYTTKKVFRDLGKNFQRNCLDLASNVIGDFNHIQPNIIQHIVEPGGRRYRRDVVEECKKCLEENQIKTEGNKGNNRRRNRKCKNKISKETTALKVEDQKSPEVKLEPTTQTEISVLPEKQTNNSSIKEENKILPVSHKDTLNMYSVVNDTKSRQNKTKTNNLTPLSDSITNNKEIIDQPSEIRKEPLSGIQKMKHFSPDYTLVFENSQEISNFHEVPEKHVRKKRYVIRVVDEDDIQDQVEDYLTQKLGDQHEYLNPLQNYYDRVNGFLNRLYSSHQPLCKIGDDCYYQRSAPAEETYAPADETNYEEEPDSLLESYEDSFEERPRKKKVQIKKMKPRVIIDKKGRPFMEYNGYKRPLMLHRKKIGLLKNTGQSYDRSDSSSEETGNRITTLIARAKTDSEVVGNSHKDIIPHQVVKERISSLLEEIDQLVNLDAENYDAIFENLIKIENIKASIEQDWKRMLIEERTNDIAAKIGLLSKFKELQHLKDSSVRKIVGALKKNDNEFVRCQLVNSLIRLQKLECLISNVVEDFEQHLKMKTPFNTKKEIKYVDFLSSLKFASVKTRNDLIKMLCKDRDSEGLKYMGMLHRLKKLLISANENPEKFDEAAKLLWELKNVEKMQIETINDMNKKLVRNFKIKKELKILFDLQRRFEDCNKELSEFLGDIHVKAGSNTVGQKKDIKEIIAEVKRKHEEMLQKAKDRSSNLLKKS